MFYLTSLTTFHDLPITCIMTWPENDDMYDGGLTSQYSVSVVNLTIGQDEIVITKQRLYTWDMQIYHMQQLSTMASLCSMQCFYIYRYAHLSSGGSHCKGLTLSSTLYGRRISSPLLAISKVFNSLK